MAKKKKDRNKKLLFAGLFGVGIVTYILLRTSKDDEPGESGASSTGNRPNPTAPGRGLQNNNPLNLKYSNTPWQGKIPQSLNTDLPFEQFDNLAFGYRAGIKNLRYYNSQGVSDIDSIIQMWAPDTTGNYEAYVKQRIGLDPDKNYNLPGGFFLDKSNMWGLVQAMAEFENNPQLSESYIHNNKGAFNDAWASL
jgi:hypothetical protein